MLAAGAAERSEYLAPLEGVAGGFVAVGEDLKGMLDFARPMFAQYIGGMGGRGARLRSRRSRRGPRPRSSTPLARGRSRSRLRGDRARPSRLLQAGGAAGEALAELGLDLATVEQEIRDWVARRLEESR